MYIHYSTGNNSGPQTLVRIVEVSIIGGVHFRRFHCKYNFTTVIIEPLTCYNSIAFACQGQVV